MIKKIMFSDARKMRSEGFFVSLSDEDARDARHESPCMDKKIQDTAAGPQAE